MAVRFSEAQLCDATGARVVRAGAQRSYEAVCTDTRALAKGCLFVALQGERFDAHDFLMDAVAGGAAAALVQAGRPLPALPRDFGVFEVPDTLAALGGLARFHRRRFKLPVGAVGGSNGKTTTKEMLGAILATRGPALKTEGNLNNEVGVPLTLLRLDPSHVAAAIEVGMNHPGEMARLASIVQPDAALITIVQPEHLEGLGSLEGVARAEGELFAQLSGSAVAVVNLDDPMIPPQAQASRARQLTFGRSERADVRLVRVEPRGKQGIRAVIRTGGAEHAVDLAFLGDHNALNATGAFALAMALGYRPDECVRGLAQARPYARRLNLVEAPGGITVLDDCYNANPASMAAALQTLKALAQGGRAVAVLGDMLELGPGELEEHQKLGAAAAEEVDLLALFGPRSERGFQAAGRLAGKAHFVDVDPLVAWLKPQLREGDVVLVKGSRGMRLERVVAALTGQAPAGGGH